MSSRPRAMNLQRQDLNKCLGFAQPFRTFGNTGELAALCSRRSHGENECSTLCAILGSQSNIHSLDAKYRRSALEAVDYDSAGQHPLATTARFVASPEGEQQVALSTAEERRQHYCALYHWEAQLRLCFCTAFLWRLESVTWGPSGA